MIQPVYNNYWEKILEKVRYDIIYDLKLKLHINAMKLTIFLCKGYRLGMIEIKRYIIYDTLKENIMRENVPLLLKRVYLKAYFEIYVNQAIEPRSKLKNDFLNLTDLKNIISSELIPSLDLKNMFHYLEGLVDLGKEEMTLKIKKWNDLRREKADFFMREKDKYKEFFMLAIEEKKDIVDQAINYRGVISDPSEYWKYIMDEGVIYFFIDTYDELYDLFHASEDVIKNLFIINNSQENIFTILLSYFILFSLLLKFYTLQELFFN